MQNVVGKFLQWMLWESRKMIIIPVIAGIVSAFIMVLIGIYDVATSILSIPTILTKQHEEGTVSIIIHIISALDAFLIATVLLIFSIGLYELFVNKISQANDHSSQVLVIHNLDELKEKVAKVIIMVLIVTFFQDSISFSYRNSIDLLYLALGIFLVSLAVYFTHKRPSRKRKKSTGLTKILPEEH